MLAAAATRAHGRRAQPLVAATEIHPPPHTSTSDPQAHSLPGTWLVYILSPNLHLDNHNAADVLHGPLRSPSVLGPFPNKRVVLCCGMNEARKVQKLLMLQLCTPVHQAARSTSHLPDLCFAARPHQLVGPHSLKTTLHRQIVDGCSYSAGCC